MELLGRGQFGLLDDDQLAAVGYGVEVSQPTRCKAGQSPRMDHDRFRFITLTCDLFHESWHYPASAPITHPRRLSQSPLHPIGVMKLVYLWRHFDESARLE